MRIRGGWIRSGTCVMAGFVGTSVTPPDSATTASHCE